MCSHSKTTLKTKAIKFPVWDQDESLKIIFAQGNSTLPLLFHTTGMTISVSEFFYKMSPTLYTLVACFKIPPLCKYESLTKSKYMFVQRRRIGAVMKPLNLPQCSLGSILRLSIIFNLVDSFGSPLCSKKIFMCTGCRDGTVVRALVSHQCGPGSIPRLGIICGLSLLVLYSAPRGYLTGYSGFPSPQKPTFDLICVNC